MKHATIFLLGLIIAKGLAAQNDTTRFFLDDKLQTSSAAQALFEAKAYPRAGKYGFVVTNRQTEKVVLDANYTDATLTVLDGPYLVFHNDGSRRTTGQYVQNKPSAIWMNWDEDGFVLDSTVYENGEKVRWISYQYSDEGLSTRTYHDVLLDSVQNVSFFNNGKIRTDQQFLHLAGREKQYYPSGALLSSTVYNAAGKRSDEVYYHEDGSEYTKAEMKKLDPNKLLATLELQNPAFTKTSNVPEMKGGSLAFQRYLDENAQIPVFLRSELQPGVIMKFSFMLDEKGRASEVHLIDPILPGLEGSVREMLRRMPYWDMKGLKSYGPVKCQVRMTL